MFLSISIVLYKTKTYELFEVVNCIRNSSFDFFLYLIDNSPNDQLKDVIKNEPNTFYIHNNKNLGYGKGHNIALKEIIEKSNYHLILNSDIKFNTDVLADLVSYLEKHTDVGLISPKMYTEEGCIHFDCKLLPLPFDLILRLLFPNSIFKKSRNKFQLIFSGYNKIMNVPFLSGCFMLIRTKALKEIGLFDERFFMYGEDIDLSRRIHNKYKTIYYPKVEITHVHAKESFKKIKLLLIHIISAIKYFNKWGWVFDKERRQINKRVLEELGYYDSR